MILVAALLFLGWLTLSSSPVSADGRDYQTPFETEPYVIDNYEQSSSYLNRIIISTHCRRDYLDEVWIIPLPRGNDYDVGSKKRTYFPPIEDKCRHTELNDQT